LVFTTPVGATHCFLQHLQFYQNFLDFETLFSDFQELLNGSGLLESASGPPSRTRNFLNELLVQFFEQ